ncbi:hypothetical protein J5N97_014299 [Dioscorea zingiberensis]|uniref:Uncharacterized protein n=1 Tax=Dioscorea zingiberensis TaxID=325984 RepID=A0A9D5HJD5_9LILI|nr:hypothetical protein J5N97_014299 [Dioscorea zingiberensis]
MVSLPCNYAVATSLPKLFFSRRTTHRSHFLQTIPYRSCRSARLPTNALGPSFFNPGPQEDRQQPRTLFPGGFKRPEIKVPTLALWLSAEEVLRTDSKAEIDAAISKGFGLVVLDSKDGSGGQLYEAAGILKPLIGDRAYLLIAERVDIATAVGASGVVLSDQGIPTIVARDMMMKSRSDSVYLPLVARTVQTANSALSASFSEGADFLIMGTEKQYNALLQENSISQQIKVPIFFSISNSHGEKLESNMALKLLQRGVCGLVMSLDYVKLFNMDDLKTFSPGHLERRKLLDGYPDSTYLQGHAITNEVDIQKRFAGFLNIQEKDMELIEAEEVLLHEAVTVIRKASPMMKEVSLLVDATSRLTEPFLLVIVGEFNSGKSTVINALLGRRYLNEGVVPTTNEITLLCYSEMDSDQQERCERYPDGQFICYLSAPILKEMNLVDTPGTNVILQRQQRLTEEFVPRADLVLFVLSSDRPLTGSEVSFLLYTQQWKKKVVFVLNKMDLFRNTSELEEAASFIRENVKKILNLEDVRLYPVSARAALDAKLSALSNDRKKFEELLLNDPRWLTSGFDELEKYLFSFLDGSTHAGQERLVLKLDTPIAIADRLLHSCEVSVKQELENASQDLVSIKEVVGSVKECAMRMESESISWRKQALSLIEKTKVRAIELVESTLQLSKVDLITYAFKGERSASIPATSVVQNDIIIPALSDAQRLLGEYSMWLQSQTAQEGKFYKEYFNKKWQAFINEKNCVHQESYELLDKGDQQSIKVVENFSASAAARLLEQEIREVVLGTFGGLGAAGLSASLLTSVLPSTLEDLLALVFCSAGGFLVISNFPTRRREAIEKVKKVADGLARDIDDAMQKDLIQTIDKLAQFVEIISKPYQEAAQDNVNQLMETQEELAGIEQKLRAMKVRIQNLHVS